MTECYRVKEHKGWSYVETEKGFPAPSPGPYRYRWEAQEYADELNSAHGECERSEKE